MLDENYRWGIEPEINSAPRPDIFAEPPSPNEVDWAAEACPWIVRHRLTFVAYVERCKQAGVEPARAEWYDHQRLSEDEQQILDDMIEARREALELELGPRFLVREYGNKAMVGWFNDRGELVTMSHREFANAHVEKMKAVGYDTDGKPILKPLVPLWLRDPLTRRYDRVEFRPGVAQEAMPERVLNLWRGWPMGLRPGWDHQRLTVMGTEPVRNSEFDGPEMPPGHCDLFLDHMLHAMCGGDEELLHYVLGWMADSLWNPGPSEVAIVLRGPQGSGKSMWAKKFMEFHSPHGITLNRPQQLTGNFNKHLHNKSVVFADEAFFAGNRQDAATLKTLITDEEIFIEPKGVDGFMARKGFRVIIASNDEHVIRAEVDDRRFLVLNVDAGEHNDDKAYFGPLLEEWEHGGRTALFRWLTGAWWGRALSAMPFRTWPRPVTAALQEQKNLSLPAPQMAVYNMLREGEVPCAHAANARRDMVFVPTDLLIRAAGLRQNERKALGVALAVVADNDAKPDRLYIGTGHDRRQYRGKWLPSLAECRRRLEAHLGRNVEWPAEVADWALDLHRQLDPDDVPF